MPCFFQSHDTVGPFALRVSFSSDTSLSCLQPQDNLLSFYAVVTLNTVRCKTLSDTQLCSYQAHITLIPGVSPM